jgi:glucosamine--fructose-6-phosphate aminotransferase (isomerizing)
MPTISVVNSVGSQIARTTKLGVYLNAGRENAVASTKAFTTQVTAFACNPYTVAHHPDRSSSPLREGNCRSQVTVLALISCWFRQLREEMDPTLDPSPEKARVLEALQRLPISFGMALRLRDQCKAVAAELATSEHLFILGKGYAEPIAYEGALKIKECTYIHAEVRARALRSVCVGMNTSERATPRRIRVRECLPSTTP